VGRYFLFEKIFNCRAFSSILQLIAQCALQYVWEVLISRLYF
jgi:hypothetical protein